ncbi:MAG: hypothetical protein ACKVS5_06175 [Parvularculaceae bacterium]
MSDQSGARRSVAETLPGEEDLRFIRNFHDIFLSLGIAMFAAGLGIATTILVGPMIEDASRASEASFQRAMLIVGAAASANALVMWLMGEFFARGRRLFLPAIVILLAFTLFFMIAAAAAYGVCVGADEAFFERLEGLGLDGVIREASGFGVTVGAATTLAIFAFYARMKLPFAMGLGAASLAGVGVAGAYYLWPERAADITNPAQLAAGLFLFLLGVAFDARDPARETRISDNGFWLHFFAAPTILNAVLALTVGLDMLTKNQTGAAVVTLTVVAGFAFVSLLINRRALLVAGLLYALVSIGVLISKVGLSGAWTAALTLLLMGGTMVLLGGGWHSIRRLVVAPFPKEGLMARIIPPEPPRESRRRVSE